jgi:hypothetical protein
MREGRFCDSDSSLLRQGWSGSARASGELAAKGPGSSHAVVFCGGLPGSAPHSVVEIAPLDYRASRPRAFVAGAPNA